MATDHDTDPPHRSAAPRISSGDQQQAVSPAAARSRWPYRLTVALASVAAVVLVVGLLLPAAAPRVMTMSTMDGLMGVERYEDQARCDFWVMDMDNPTQRIERQFDCGFYWDWSQYDDGRAYVHEALLDLESGNVFEVPGMERGRMEEWYHVDGHMLTEGALRFDADATLGAGVLMPPPGARDRVTMGWVESGGERGGAQRVVFPRDLREVGTDTVEGIDVVEWESRFSREPVQWHGYDVLLSEEVSFLSDPRTAWILSMHRHVTVEMTPQQMGAYLGLEAPGPLDGLIADASGNTGTQAIMELDYRTTSEGRAAHVDEDGLFRAMVTPIESWWIVAIAGAAGAAVCGLLGRLLKPQPAPAPTTFRTRQTPVTAVAEPVS